MNVPAALAALLLAQAAVAPLPAHVTPPQTPPQTVKGETRPMTDEESAMLPPGEGRDAVAAMCVPCHGLARSLVQRRTAPGWAALVEDMRVKGAEGTDEQVEAATKYLAKFFAAVDVNTATAKELVEVAGFTETEATAIVEHRDAGHAFKSFSDVRKIPGLDPKRLTAARPRLVYR